MKGFSLAALKNVALGIWQRISGSLVRKATGAERINPPPMLPKRVRPTKYESEIGGRFYTLSDVLAQLDEYIGLMNEVRRIDREAYDLFSKIGGAISPAATLLEITHKRLSIPSHWPTAFMTFFSGTNTSETEQRETDRCPSRAVYFVKCSRPSNVQVFDGVIYRGCSVVKLGTKHYPLSFHIGITADGTVTPLKERRTNSQHFIRGKKSFTVHHQGDYAYPAFRNALRYNLGDVGASFSEWCCAAFSIGISHARSVESGLLVRAKREGVCASFAIEMLRTPDFFKDRDIVVNHGGQKKRIFHYVRPHVRSDGRTVKSHFRGLREFVWKGFEITISVPGLHIGVPTEVDITPAESFDEDVGQLLDMSAFGAKWSGLLEADRTTRDFREGRYPPLAAE